MIQNIEPHKFHNEYRPEAKPSPESSVLRMKGRNPLARVLEINGEKRMEFPKAKAFDTEKLVYAFSIDETEYFLDISGSTDEIEGFSFDEFKGYRRELAESHMYGMIVFTADHLNQWYLISRHCGFCGAATVHSKKERAMHCPKCGREIYPSIMPAVIVGVKNGDKLLMTKYRGRDIAYYALIAGFVEIGETLEECVAREVMEETGIKVKNIRYYKSQPWGMARDLLAGFYCEVDGDDAITIDRNELKLAEWVNRDEIELQPDDYSRTNEMMKTFKEGIEK